MKMKKIEKLLGIAIVLVIIAIMSIACVKFREKPEKGDKKISIEVVNIAGDSVVYEVDTDALYLQGAMEEAEGLEFEMDGTMLISVNGEEAIYEVDQSYWALYINGDYANYGISEQPIKDGDTIKIEYTIYE